MCKSNASLLVVDTSRYQQYKSNLSPLLFEFLPKQVLNSKPIQFRIIQPIHFNLIECLKTKLPHSGMIIFEDFLCLSVNFSYKTKDSRLKSASAHFNELKKCWKGQWSHVRVIVFEGARSLLRCLYVLWMASTLYMVRFTPLSFYFLELLFSLKLVS